MHFKHNFKKDDIFNIFKMTNVIFFVLKASLKELSQTDDEDKRTFFNLPERNFPAVWLGYSLV